MRIPRVLLREPFIAGANLRLPQKITLYLSQVLRLSTGDNVILMDGIGNLAHAQIITMSKREWVVSVQDIFNEQRESPLNITLWQCLSKGDRMDYTLQKAVELGVTRIVPVMSERVNLRLDAERLVKRYDHWQGVIDSAAMQSCRTQVPLLQPTQSITQLCEHAAKQYSLCLVLDPKATQTCKLLSKHTHIDLLVGSEGGLTDSELTQLIEAGFIGINLGPRVLRTETAGLVILSLLQGLWGDL